MRKLKLLSAFMTVTVSFGLLTGCGSSNDKTTTAKQEDKSNNTKYSIVCSTFPQYDWVKELVKGKEDNFDITMLLKNGMDLHSYKPSADDIVKIGTSDLFIYVGGESDTWVDDALKEAVNKNMKSVNMLKAIGDAAKEEETVEGMQGEDEEEGEYEDEKEIDEHVWLSLKNAKTIVNDISNDLQEIDENDKDTIKTNTDAYVKSLEDLDGKYQKAVDNGKNRTILFGDRFPFRYMVEDYGLKYYAAFVGCSAETEASFETITFLAKKVDELKLKYILTIENSDDKIANTIKENTKDKNQEILILNSIQSVKDEDISNGFTYIKAMEDNLTVLEKVLNN